MVSSLHKWLNIVVVVFFPVLSLPESAPESLNSLELSPRKTGSLIKEIMSSKEPPKRRRIIVPKKVVGQIESILRAFPTGIWVSRFPVEFKVGKLCCWT